MAEYPISVAHAAMKFIAAKGLHDEFFNSGALTGHYCDEHCGHAEPPKPQHPVSDTSDTSTLNRSERSTP